MTRYVIIGAGAVGGTIGGRLAQAGRAAVLVARGDHLQAMREDGLRLRTPEEDVTIPVETAAGPDEVELDTDDVLVIATKTQQMSALLPTWADRPVRHDGEVVGRASSTLPVLTATNGVAAEELALRYFDRVFGVCLWLPALRIDPGVVVARGTPTSGVLHVGRVPATATDAADRALLDRLEQDLSGARFGIERPVDVMPWKYRKLLSNLANVLNALLGDVGSDDDDLRAAVDAEAREVLAAAGCVVTSDEEEAAARRSSFGVAEVPGVDGPQGSSTWQSLTRGTGDIETDYLNGEIALIARRLGRRAPLNAGLAELGREAASTGQRPGDVTVADLTARLGRTA